MEVVSGSRRSRDAGRGLLSGAPGRRRHRHAICGPRGRRSTSTTSRRSASRSTARASRSSAASPRPTSAGRWPSCSTARCSRRRASRAPITQAEARITGRFTQQEVAGSVARPAVRRAAGVADLSRAARGRAVARRRTRFAPASWRRSSASRSSRSSCSSTTSSPGINAFVSIALNLSSCSASWRTSARS